MVRPSDVHRQARHLALAGPSLRGIGGFDSTIRPIRSAPHGADVRTADGDARGVAESLRHRVRRLSSARAWRTPAGDPMDPRTDTDRFIVEQMQPLLRPQERLLVCAYLVPPIKGGRIGVFVSAATSMAAFAAITTERLVLIQTRIGAFKPLLENHGVVSLERSDIKGAHAGSTLILELSDGSMLEYRNNRSMAQVSTQGEFFDRVESTFGRSATAASLAGRRQWNGAIALAVGIVLALLYAAYRLHGQ